MPEESAPSRLLRFGVFEVDLRAGELRKHGLKVRLQEQPFQILAMLLECPGEVVTREELRRKLWPADVFVDFDEGLNNAVKKLRAALGDSAENPRFVETLARHGYRFLAPVNGADMPAAVVAAAPEAMLRRARTAALVLLAMLAVLSLAVWRRTPTHPKLPSGKTMLAVLPFDNLTGNPEQDYFSDGLTEEMIAQLGNLDPQRLGVIARASAMQYKHSTKGAAQIGRELGVDYILEGSVRRQRGRARITAQLIQASDQTHLWGQSYEGELSNILALQSDVAQAVARTIEIKLTLQRQAPLASASRVDAEAHDLYLRGMFFLNKKTVDGLRRSIDCFQQAIDKDPGYAMPYVGIAQASELLGHYTVLAPREAYPRAKAVAARALELDGGIAEAHTHLAWAKLFFDRDWSGAQREFQRALELNPNSALAHQGYAMYFVAMGQLNEALEEMNRAKKLDPVSLHVKTDKGWFLYYARQPDEAIRELRETIDMDPNFPLPHFALGQAYELKGMFDPAIAEFQKAITLYGGGSTRSGSLGHAYAVSGRKGKAIEVLGKLERLSRQEYVSPYHIALIYAALDDKDLAFAWLEKAYRDHYWMIAFLKVDPRLEPLHSDPRYGNLLRRSGLVP